MTHTVTAVFDGSVLHPDTPLDLEPGTRYTLTIQPDSAASVEDDAWDVLERLAGTVDAPPDWASEHDHYLYGTVKHLWHSQTSVAWPPLISSASVIRPPTCAWLASIHLCWMKR